MNSNKFFDHSNKLSNNHQSDFSVLLSIALTYSCILEKKLRTEHLWQNAIHGRYANML